MMDANSPIEDPAIQAFMDANNLHDLMEEFLPDDPPPTYKRGTTKIDHILGTIGIVFAMTGAGIIPFGKGPNSDHAILHIDFSLEMLCGTHQHYSLTRPTQHHGTYGLRTSRRRKHTLRKYAMALRWRILLHV
jgi:hypothetical protein